jgi:hypothetical protein
MNCNDSRTDMQPESKARIFMIPIGAICRWWTLRRIKKDIDNIKRYEDIADEKLLSD